MVLSADKNVDLQALALNAANAALYTSNLPIKKSVCGVRVGRIKNNYVINPTPEQMFESTLDLYVAGSKDELLMIEMKTISSSEMVEVDIESFTKIHNANEMNEDSLVEAIAFAQKIYQENSSKKVIFSAKCKFAQYLERKRKDEMIEAAVKAHPYAKWMTRKVKGEIAMLASNEHLADATGAIAAGIITNEFRGMIAMLRGLKAA
jgi:polyribonucleotide nucleotidyltransferase